MVTLGLGVGCSAVSAGLSNYHLEKGNRYVEQGNTDLAMAEYDQAIKLNPRDVLIFYDRGTINYQRGDLDLALADFDQAIQLDPELASAYLNRGLSTSIGALLILLWLT